MVESSSLNIRDKTTRDVMAAASGTLTGQVAVVTGAASGLGREIALTLAHMGARVIGADVSAVEADELGFAPVMPVLVDVTDEAAVRAMVKRVHLELGRIHILVNCAGVIYKDALENLNEQEWQRVLAVNLTGPMLCAKHVATLMKEYRYGRIINISSMMAVTAAETYSAYCGSKAALLQCTKVWALELAPFGITVNAICPGWLDTPMSRKFIESTAKRHGCSNEDGLKKILSVVPQRRFLSLAEVAGLVGYLVGEGARGITGAGILIDGGTTVGMPYGVHRSVEEAGLAV
ncbi:MAG: SDR family oxidoreductase [Azonexus sp.]|nr:SDR family oxidoreductase [Azonexus sp.]